MIYILIFVIGILLIKLNELNKEMKIYKDILQKYKSIIGVEDENKRN